jgi:imidazole glycerol-phosphate synthase subunit HisF
MLAKRIIPCLDVKHGQVVKGIQFGAHTVMGEIMPLATAYSDMGADELVFYDITASCEERAVDYRWVNKIADVIDIPFCVAGGIRTLSHAKQILRQGADKISINSPALENPQLISELAQHFGCQCVVVGIDSRAINGQYFVCQYTGDEKKRVNTQRLTEEWLQEVVERGAGEIVLNCMDQDGMRKGYDITQLCYLQSKINIPLIASGGAGSLQHFADVFEKTKVSGALAASVFHGGSITIPQLKKFLSVRHIEVRLEN